MIRLKEFVREKMLIFLLIVKIFTTINMYLRGIFPFFITTYILVLFCLGYCTYLGMMFGYEYIEEFIEKRDEIERNT